MSSSSTSTPTPTPTPTPAPAPAPSPSTPFTSSPSFTYFTTGSSSMGSSVSSLTPAHTS